MLDIDYEMRLSQIQLQNAKKIAELEKQHAMEIERLQQKNDRANSLLVGLSQYLQENGLLERTSTSAKTGASHQPTPK